MAKIFKAITKAAPAVNREGTGRTRPLPDRAPVRAPAGGRVEAVSNADHGHLTRVSALDDRLAAVNESSSLVAESFRRLRTKLLHPPAGGVPRSILITSVAPNEGKGFVAANLAIALSQGVEQHALLVDCDCRRPTLAGLFGLSNERGLVDYLLDDTNLSSLIKKTDIPKLSILPAGPPPGNPSELLGSAKMAALMEELLNKYQDRFVIFDSPPMQAAAETTVLAKHVDGVVLVVRWGGPGREQVKKLAKMIGKDKIAGVVFNGVQVNELENRLYRYHGYDGYGGSYHPQV